MLGPPMSWLGSLRRLFLGCRMRGSVLFNLTRGFFRLRSDPTVGRLSAISVSYSAKSSVRTFSRRWRTSSQLTIFQKAFTQSPLTFSYCR